MFAIRKADQRGHANYGWLDTYHSFSFGGYRDPRHMQFRSLRVINEDRVEPGQGFGTHPHRDMEIVTYVLSGALEHRDSMGHREVLRPGELQRMTAGTGITHSEYNPSAEAPVHLYQIWILPNQRGLEPSYEQKSFAADERMNRFQVVVSPDATDRSLRIRQDVRILLATLTPGHTVQQVLEPGRHAWLQILRGATVLNESPLFAGDGVAISDEQLLQIGGEGGAEVMLFDLA
jgi:redox-sensitive bicupin YhaK (pirin superfamily)